MRGVACRQALRAPEKGRFSALFDAGVRWRDGSRERRMVGSGGGGRIARAAEGVESGGDGGGLGDDGAYEEASSAAKAESEGDGEGSFEKRRPVESGEWRVELAAAEAL